MQKGKKDAKAVKGSKRCEGVQRDAKDVKGCNGCK